MNDQLTSPRSLRIAVLAHNSRFAGGLSVGKNLLGALARQAPQHEYIVALQPGLGYEEVCAGIPRCRMVPCHPRGGPVGLMLFEMFKLPRLLRPTQPEVILALGNRGLLKPPCPQAIYIQDAHYCYPTRYFAGETWKNKLNKRVQTWLISRQLRRSKLMFCQTPVMEKRAKEAFGYHGRTAICPNAVSAFAVSEANPPMPEPMAAHADKMRLFYVAKFYGHKNFEGIVETFRRHREALKDVVVFLTIAADQHPRAPRFLRSIDRYNLGGNIINVGPIPQSALPGYYRHSHALLMPSFLESFSGTYLEAMHFGTPILASDMDFAHGVCGPAAVYFDPWLPAAMKDAILRLKNDPALAADLVERGARQLQTMFRSWDRIAGDVVKVLAEIAETE